MAHRLISGASPKCSIPHGHNEFVQVTIVQKDEKPMDHHVNMLESFAILKKKWHQFIDDHLNHAFQVSNQDPLIEFFRKNEPEKISRLVVTPGDPTTEIMCACLMSKLQAFLDELAMGLICQQIKIEETPTNSVILTDHLAFEKHLPKINEIPQQNPSIPSNWWARHDFSINDL